MKLLHFEDVELSSLAETWESLLVNRPAMCEPSLTGPQKKDTLRGWLRAWLSLPVDNASGDQHWKDVKSTLSSSKYYVYRFYTYLYYDMYIGTSYLSTVIQPWADAAKSCFLCLKCRDFRFRYVSHRMKFQGNAEDLSGFLLSVLVILMCWSPW